MMESWVDFVFNVIGGATAFFACSTGTRRLCAYGVHSKALFDDGSGGRASVPCTAASRTGTISDLKATLSMNQRKAAAFPLPANWGRLFAGKEGDPERPARARRTFTESGTLAGYVDRSGGTRTLADAGRSDAARAAPVAYYARAEYSARGSLAEALLWPIIALIAVLFES